VPITIRAQAVPPPGVGDAQCNACSCEIPPHLAVNTDMPGDSGGRSLCLIGSGSSAGHGHKKSTCRQDSIVTDPLSTIRGIF